MSTNHQVDNRRRVLARFILLGATICLLHQGSISSFVRSANASEDVANITKEYIAEEYELLANR